MEFKEMRNKRHKDILSSFGSLEQIHNKQMEITTIFESIKDELSASYYAKNVAIKGFGVGDVITKDGLRVKIAAYASGMFWGEELGDKRKKKLTPIYDGWKLL